VNAIRSSTKMRDARHPDFPRIMPDAEQNVLVVRASDSLMAEAEKLVQQLDSRSTKQ
jgi:type II secretory pathway component GspD/PulD (secretin)